MLPLETMAEVEPITVVPPLALIPLNDPVPVMTTVVTNDPGATSVTGNDAVPLNRCCTSVGVVVTIKPPVIRAKLTGLFPVPAAPRIFACP